MFVIFSSIFPNELYLYLFGNVLSWKYRIVINFAQGIDIYICGDFFFKSKNLIYFSSYFHELKIFCNHLVIILYL